MKLTLHVWRQKDAASAGRMATYRVSDISPEMSFIEMLNAVNSDLVDNDEEPIAFDCDCLEGICGTCNLVINGTPHGPQKGTTTCQLHMRHFADGDHITIEPWRANPSR